MTTKGERPTYQNALRAIGRYLDRNVYRRVLLSEVDDGYIVRAFPGLQGDLKAEGLALPFADVLALIASHEQVRGLQVATVQMPPLCPTGYEDFFRSLGHDLDAVDATDACLVELSGGFLLTYTAGWVSGGGRAQMFYDPPRIDGLLSRGHRRRGKVGPAA